MLSALRLWKSRQYRNTDVPIVNTALTWYRYITNAMFQCDQRFARRFVQRDWVLDGRHVGLLLLLLFGPCPNHGSSSSSRDEWRSLSSADRVKKGVGRFRLVEKVTKPHDDHHGHDDTSCRFTSDDMSTIRLRFHREPVSHANSMRRAGARKREWEVKGSILPEILSLKNRNTRVLYDYYWWPLRHILPFLSRLSEVYRHVWKNYWKQ